MDEFLRDGQSLLETASAAAGAADEIAIIIGRDGSLRGVAGLEWTLEALAAEHGARAVYRVSRRGARVRVEGRSGARSLVLEEESPAAAAVRPGFTRRPRPLLI